MISGTKCWETCIPSRNARLLIMTYAFFVSVEIQSIKCVFCSREPTAVEIWTKCLFSLQCGSCQQSPVSFSPSLRWNSCSFHIWLLMCLQCQPQTSGWLAAFCFLFFSFLSSSSFPFLFLLAAKCCRHMFIHAATRWNMSQLNEKGLNFGGK